MVSELFRNVPWIGSLEGSPFLKFRVVVAGGPITTGTHKTRFALSETIKAVVLPVQRDYSRLSGLQQWTALSFRPAAFRPGT
jgi:hypothetical protein